MNPSTQTLAGRDLMLRMFAYDPVRDFSKANIKTQLITFGRRRAMCPARLNLPEPAMLI
jgi:hypothetical protein